MVEKYPINVQAYYELPATLTKHYGTTLERKFNLRPKTVGQALNLLISISNWLNDKVQRMELQLEKLLKQETKTIREK